MGDVLLETCDKLQYALGTQNLEATYQRALCIELTEIGLTVDQEVPINLMYKGHVVGHRRADIIVTLKDGSRIIIEMKAIAMI